MQFNLEEDPTILKFPITFDDTTVFEDRQVLKCIQIIHYLRQNLPRLFEVGIDKYGVTELRIYIIDTERSYSYRQYYRIKLSDKPSDKLPILTGQGRKYCTGLNSFVKSFQVKND